MAEKKREVQLVTYQITYDCDEPNCKGKVEYFNPSGHLYTNNWGTQYPHKCTSCGKSYLFHNVSYPHTSTEIKE